MPLTDDESLYVKNQLATASMDISALWAEMDAVWDQLGLDNRKLLSAQLPAVGRYYAHPIWTVNGLFSEIDPVSRGHREAIGRFIASIPHARVADYGGGSGVLAKMIGRHAHEAQVEIVEPYPSPFFLERMAAEAQVKYVPLLRGPYDVVIAQDVLEHVDDPIGVAIEVLAATAIGGRAIFANAFHPYIKCHLPPTFFLRHQFNRMLALCGTEHEGGIAGAEHAHVFVKRRQLDVGRLRALERVARVTGPVLNGMGHVKFRVRRMLDGMR